MSVAGAGEFGPAGILVGLGQVVLLLTLLVMLTRLVQEDGGKDVVFGHLSLHSFGILAKIKTNPKHVR